jgi:serine/threonine protein kinase
MKVCPKCGALFSEEIKHCPNDSEKLYRKDQSDLIGHEIDNRYMILDIIGEGGWGIVYKVYQRSLERTIALKVLRKEILNDPRIVELFLVEAKAVSKLSCPNTITLHDFGQADDGTLYIAMELLEGKTLADLLEKDRIIPPKRAAYILTQVCDSLSEAHGRGIVHLDMKPENIFLAEGFGRSDFVKVLDFGIAKITGSEQKPMESPDFVLGSPIYMSPEQAQGKATGSASDIYSLGVILFEMLAGSPPFDDEKPLQILMKHVYDPPPKLLEKSPDKNLPEELIRLVESSLSKDPRKRPSDITDFKKSLVKAAQPKKDIFFNTKDLKTAEKKSGAEHVKNSEIPSGKFELEVDFSGTPAKKRLPVTFEERKIFEQTKQMDKKRIEQAVEMRKKGIERKTGAYARTEHVKTIGLGSLLSLLAGAAVITVISLLIAKFDQGKLLLTKDSLPRQEFQQEQVPAKKIAPQEQVQKVEKKSRFVELTFKSTPPKAVIKINGRALGSTPLTIYEKSGSEEVTAEFILSPGISKTVMFIPDKSQVLEVTF